MKIFDAIKTAWWAAKSVYTTTNMHLAQWYQGVIAHFAGVSYDRLSRRAFENPVSARGLRLVGQLMSSVPFVVELPDGDMVDRHEMMGLIERPNKRLSRSGLCEQIVTHLYCAGEVFMRRVTPGSGPNTGKPTAAGGGLYLLSPGDFDEFQRERGTGEITGYYFRDRYDGTRVLYDVDEVLHIRIYNPGDPERGMPILLGANRALEMSEAADAWNKSLSAGGGRVAGYFTPEIEGGKTLTPEQVAAAQEQADRTMAERQRGSTSLVLSGAFKYQQASMTLRDADFLKLSQKNDRHIAAVIGVSSTLLGDEKATSLTDAGIDSEVRAAYLLTVLPLLDYVLAEVNAWLSPVYAGAKLGYDRDQIEALSDDLNALFSRYTQAVGGPWMTVNEAREANNWEKLPGKEYDGVRRAAEQDMGDRVVRDGDADGDAGEGQTAKMYDLREEIRLRFAANRTPA